MTLKTLPYALFASSCVLAGCNGTSQLGMPDTSPTDETLGELRADWRIPRLIEDVAKVCTFRSGPMTIKHGDEVRPFWLCGGKANHAGTSAAVADVKKTIDDSKYRMVFGLLVAAIGADEDKKDTDGDPKTERMHFDVDAAIDESFTVPGLSVNVAGVTFACKLEGSIEAKLDALTIDGVKSTWASGKAGKAGLRTTLETSNMLVTGTVKGKFAGCKAGLLKTPSILSTQMSFDFVAEVESIDASLTLWPRTKPAVRDIDLDVTADVDVNNASIALKLDGVPKFAQDTLKSGGSATAVRSAIEAMVDDALGNRLEASLTKALPTDRLDQAAEMFEALIAEDQVFCGGAFYTSSEGKPAARFRYDDAKPAIRPTCVDYN